MSMQVFGEEGAEVSVEGTTGDDHSEGVSDGPVGESPADVPVEETPDVQMSRGAAVSFLERRGWGCLTLADGGAAYSVPMSFGYDGEGTLYFQMQDGDDSEKMAYLDATTTATFLVPEVRPPDWTSVIVRGEVAPVPDCERDAAYAAFADNAWFPLCPWTAEKDPADVTFYKLDVQELTGRTSLAGE